MVFRSGRRQVPSCSACRQDGIYDRSARIRRAVVRVEFGREPYGAKLCGPHLAALERSNLPGGAHVVERYDEQPQPRGAPLAAGVAGTEDGRGSRDRGRRPADAFGLVDEALRSLPVKERAGLVVKILFRRPLPPRLAGLNAVLVHRLRWYTWMGCAYTVTGLLWLMAAAFGGTASLAWFQWFFGAVFLALGVLCLFAGFINARRVTRFGRWPGN